MEESGTYTEPKKYILMVAFTYSSGRGKTYL
jgi:hypothetical protein